MRFAPVLILLVACGGGEDDSAATASGTPSTQPTSAAVDCSDPAENPFAGTCVETYLAGCFDPVGTCEGDVALTGRTELIWESGASVLTEIDFSDPFNPGAITTLTNSSGTECAVGVTENNTGSCASQTTYTRTADGATQVYCIQLDGSMTITCDDNTTVEVPASQGDAANQCQYGDAEPCEMNVPGM